LIELKTIFQQRLLLLLVCFCCAMGCAVDEGKVYLKNGKEYGRVSGIWRDRWWNFYQRGNSYAEGEYWPEAIADYRAAIGQNPNDQWQARTYGFHFLDYFPHRELGIVFYRLNRYPEAIREFEISLHNAETAKAKFYLNNARKAWLIEIGKDSGPPKIFFNTPESSLLTNDIAFKVIGHVNDDTFVSRVVIDGRPQFIELAEPLIHFSQEIPLEEGLNTIEVSATDLIGQTAHKHLSIEVDRHGPLLSVGSVTLVGEASRQYAVVKGVISDRSPITRFSLAGREMPLSGATELAFFDEFPVAPDTVSLLFSAEDAAGNVTHGEISIASSSDDVPTTLGDVRHASESLWDVFQRRENTFSGNGAVRHASLIVGQWQQVDPIIKIRGLEATQKVYKKRLYIEGQVLDDSTITGLSINQEPLLNQPGRQIFFNYIATLKPGENQFVLEAVDSDGNVGREEILVIYEIPEIEQLSSRLRVVLLPFGEQGDGSLLTKAVYDGFFNALEHQNRFGLVERLELDQILQELKFSQTKLVDQSAALKVGKILAAEGMLLGTITEKSRSLQVYTRFVDVETTEMFASEDVYGENLTLTDLRTLMDGLAWKLCRRFPLVGGIVLEIERDIVTVNLADAENIKKNMKIIIFREGKQLKNPETGRTIRKPPEQLGEARIKAVSKESAEAILDEPQNAERLQVLDKVVTK
jgi:hypothetical protein